MKFDFQKENKLLVALLLVVMVLYFFSMLIFGTSTFSDPMRGYEIMNQFSEGGKWNSLSYPSIKNPIYSYYVAWWSPAQWFFPFLLSSFFSIQSFQIIQFIFISSCLSISLIGYYKLFKKLGISTNIALLSLLCIATNQLFYWHTILYYGGDLFLVAFLPFYLIFMLNWKEKFTLKYVVLFIILGIFGVFLKNTFLFILLCSCSFFFFSSGKVSFFQRIKDTILPFSVFVFVYFITKSFHLSLGETPGSATDFEGYSGVTNNLIGDVTFSIGSPVGIFTRFSFFIQKTNAFLQNNLLKSNVLQIIPFLLTILLLVQFKKENYKTYFSLLFYFCIPFLSLFIILYLQNKAVSYEMRHFAPVSFLFFPAILLVVTKSRFKKIIFAAIISICLLDMGLYFLSLKKLEETHAFWNTLKLPKEDVEIMVDLQKWDDSTKNGLVVFEDYWQLSVSIRKNDKLILKKKKNNLFVVSGMELDFPSIYHCSPSIVKNYSSVILVSSNSKPNGILTSEWFRSFQLVQKTTNFSLYRSVETKSTIYK